MEIRIDPAVADDRTAILSLLKQAHLPVDDLPSSLQQFVIAREYETAVGVAGMERFGPIGLLRSVAVDPHYQNRGIAVQLINQLIASARANQLTELYLITTTADRYFERHGFVSVDRQQAPSAIRQTQQFGSLCPASAIVMRYTLTRHNL